MENRDQRAQRRQIAILNRELTTSENEIKKLLKTLSDMKKTEDLRNEKKKVEEDLASKFDLQEKLLLVLGMLWSLIFYYKQRGIKNSWNVVSDLLLCHTSRLKLTGFNCFPKINKTQIVLSFVFSANITTLVMNIGTV